MPKIISADYNTKKMINILFTKEARPAMELLRSDFLGMIDFKPINDVEKIKLAEFLTAEGVLIRDEMNINNFKMSSTFIDELIQQQVIPYFYNI